jgi:hypothetical protein
MEMAIPTDADYRNIRDKSVRNFIRDVFADVSITTSSAESDHSGGTVRWTKVLLRALYSCRVKVQTFPLNEGLTSETSAVFT